MIGKKEGIKEWRGKIGGGGQSERRKFKLKKKGSLPFHFILKLRSHTSI
jgi:hypothetical protein